MKKLVTSIAITLSLLGCASSSHKSIEPISDFVLSDYLGKWYEIARIDHGFQKNIVNGTAQYRLREDGLVEVINQGFNENNKEWEKAIGVAKLKGESNIAHLRVSFFWPIYGDYKVFYLESDYSVALVTGSTSEYYWLLSRTPTLPREDIVRYMHIAKDAGIDVSKVIFTGKGMAKGSM